jgi:hypothetical protein
MKDLEFHVSAATTPKTEKVLKDFGEACAYAVSRCVSGELTMLIDVVTWSRAAARAWGGDAAVERYEEDPDASVHERIVIKAHSQGQIP